MSFYSIIQIAEQLNNDKKLGSLEMAVLYDKLPENIKKQIIKPYISIDKNEARDLNESKRFYERFKEEKIC